MDDWIDERIDVRINVWIDEMINVWIDSEWLKFSKRHETERKRFE